MKRTIIVSVLLAALPLLAISPEEVLRKVDSNEVFKTIRYSGVMTIAKGGRHRERVKEFSASAEGGDKAYIEFTNPGDRGIKYLKLGDELWIKSPYAEEPEKLSGHFLRESMMGSDYSYEDTMENNRLLDLYTVKLLGEESVSGRQCYKLELTAKVEKVSYARQIMWVDQERFVAMKVEYYALSGKLLKEMTVEEVREVNGRPFPVKIRMENKIREGSYTLFEMKSVELDVALDPSLFTKRQIEQ